MKSFILLAVVSILGKIAYANPLIIPLADNYAGRFVEEKRFLDLLSAAEAGADVSKEYQERYSNRTVRLVTPYLTNNEKFHLVIKDDLISIRNLQIITRVIKSFGHFIPRLDIKQKSKKNAEIIVSNLINLHCSNTLTELNLELSGPYDDFFNKLSQPFRKVKNITLNGYFKTLDAPTHNFAELFPVMKHLSFGPNANVLDANNFNHGFKWLDHLSFSVSLLNAFGPRMHENFRNLIEKNPHIRSLTMIHTKRDLVKFIADNLPKLENLKLLWVNDYDVLDAYDIHFNHVKTLSIEYLGQVFGERQTNAPKNLFFNNIEALETESFNGHSQTWLDFVERSSKLKKLHIVKGTLYDSTFVGLISIAPNLVEFSARVQNRVSDDKMLEFIRNHSQLTKVHWSRTSDFQPTAEHLRQEIGDQWMIETAGEQHIFLERKNQ